MNKKKTYVYRSILSPVALILYVGICFYTASLLQYGGVKRKLSIIIGLTMALIISIIVKFLKLKKEDEDIDIELNRTWYFVAIVVLLTTTVLTGISIYKSGTNYQGKLAWFLSDLKNKKEIEIKNDNIYDSNIEGVLADINEQLDLPSELYMVNNLEVKYAKDGRIKRIETFLYGKDEEGKTKSFLISYDDEKDKKASIYLNGYSNGDYDDRKKVGPFIDTLKLVSLEDIAGGAKEEEYQIFYEGYVNQGFNKEDIVYRDEDGIRDLDEDEEARGYLTVLRKLGVENDSPTIKYINNSYDIDIVEEEETWDIGYSYNDGDETFFLNKDMGYQLAVVDAALGSRFYEFRKTIDGGTSWKAINKDPFLNQTGVSSGIVFIDDSLGFISLSHNGGSEANLYRTDDAGISFEKVVLPEIKLDLGSNESYNPFDFPEDIYMKSENLYLELGQGSDGDYKGGIKALYESGDRGRTWIYIGEVD